MVTAGVTAIAPLDMADAREAALERLEAVAIVHVEINGVDYQLQLEPRVTLLDMFCEQLQLTGPKKG